MMFTSATLNYKSINELNETSCSKQTSLKNMFKRNEYVPKIHGMRNCIVDTDYNLIKSINKKSLDKMKKNRIFDKNRVDGLLAFSWDGVELNETKKNIDNLPEREYADGDIRKYIKYLVVMNTGPRVNILIDSLQMTEKEKILSDTGRLKAKTFGETTAFQDMWPSFVDMFGYTSFVNIMDALFLNANVLNLINGDGQYFVVRMEDETRLIYQDAEGLFKKTNPKEEYEMVEVTTNKKVVYSKTAKHKNYQKTKTRIITRKVTDKKLNDKILVEERTSEKKNSTVYYKTYEKVIKRVQVWSDTFELTNYVGNVRVVRSLETVMKKDKKTNEYVEVTNEIYICTNMITHDLKTIIKMMHIRWNIENNGFRTLKQQYHANHIYVGEFNAINYIMQMIILAFNLMQIYIYVRKKDKLTFSFNQITKIFEAEIRSTKDIWKYLIDSS